MARPRSAGPMSLALAPSISRSPAVMLFEPGDHAQQGRLAAAGRADEDDELAVGDVEVDSLDDLDFAVVLADAAQGNSGHGMFLI